MDLATTTASSFRRRWIPASALSFDELKQVQSPWVTAICLADFDLDLGPRPRYMLPCNSPYLGIFDNPEEHVPPGGRFPHGDKSTQASEDLLSICCIAFPDATGTLKETDSLFSFRLRIPLPDSRYPGHLMRLTKAPSRTALLALAEEPLSTSSQGPHANDPYSMALKAVGRRASSTPLPPPAPVCEYAGPLWPPALGPEPVFLDASSYMGKLYGKASGYLYGYVHYRQRQDPSIKRGYAQQAVILLSGLPLPSVFLPMVGHISSLVHKFGTVALEAAWREIASWPWPCIPNLSPRLTSDQVSLSSMADRDAVTTSANDDGVQDGGRQGPSSPEDFVSEKVFGELKSPTSESLLLNSLALCYPLHPRIDPRFMSKPITLPLLGRDYRVPAPMQVYHPGLQLARATEWFRTARMAARSAVSEIQASLQHDWNVIREKHAIEFAQLGAECATLSAEDAKQRMMALQKRHIDESSKFEAARASIVESSIAAAVAQIERPNFTLPPQARHSSYCLSTTSDTGDQALGQRAQSYHLKDSDGLREATNLYGLLGPRLVPLLWHLWTLVVTGEHIMVVAPSAFAASQTVLALASLGPVPWAGTLRPLLTVYDRDYNAVAHDIEIGLTRAKSADSLMPDDLTPTLDANDGQRQESLPRSISAGSFFQSSLKPSSASVNTVPPSLIGTTNPLFLRSLGTHPNILLLGASPPDTELLCAAADEVGLTPQISHHRTPVVANREDENKSSSNGLMPTVSEDIAHETMKALIEAASATKACSASAGYYFTHNIETPQSDERVAGEGSPLLRPKAAINDLSALVPEPVPRSASIESLGTLVDGTLDTTLQEPSTPHEQTYAFSPKYWAPLRKPTSDTTILGNLIECFSGPGTLVSQASVLAAPNEEVLGRLLTPAARPAALPVQQFGKTEQPKYQTSLPPGVVALNNSVLRAHFDKLNEAFLRPFAPYVEMPQSLFEVSTFRSFNPYLHIPQLLPFSKEVLLNDIRSGKESCEEFLSLFTFKHYPNAQSSGARRKLVDLYAQFMATEHFKAWFEAKRAYVKAALDDLRDARIITLGNLSEMDNQVSVPHSSSRLKPLLEGLRLADLLYCLSTATHRRHSSLKELAEARRALTLLQKKQLIDPGPGVRIMPSPQPEAKSSSRSNEPPPENVHSGRDAEQKSTQGGTPDVNVPEGCVTLESILQTRIENLELLAAITASHLAEIEAAVGAATADAASQHPSSQRDGNGANPRSSSSASAWSGATHSTVFSSRLVFRRADGPSSTSGQQ